MNRFVFSALIVAGFALSPALAASTPDSSAQVYEAVKSGQWAEAEKVLRQSLSQNPNDTAGMLNLAYVLQNTGRGAEAMSIYEKVLQQDSNPAVAIGESDKLRAKVLAKKRIGSIYSAQR